MAGPGGGGQKGPPVGTGVKGARGHSPRAQSVFQLYTTDPLRRLNSWWSGAQEDTPSRYVSVTTSFHHDIVDGGSAARFTNGFEELIESGFGLSGYS